MKILYHVISCCLLIALFSCKPKTKNEKFVSIEHQKFYLEGAPFFPLMVNYGVTLREVDGEVLFGPTREYDDYETFDSETPEELRNRLNTHFKLIAEMGFNAIRIVGATSLDYKSLYPDLAFPIHHNEDSTSMFNITKQPKKIVDALEALVDAAKNNEIKIMLLLPVPKKDQKKNKHRLKYIKSILKRFSTTPSIFAYDFFNEPLYFDNEEYDSFEERHTSKKEAHEKTKVWRSYMNRYAPDQLLTIGLSEPIEVFEWDPSVLDVDFLAFHVYNPLRVKNEIYWYSTYIDKPWMLGEIGLSADNDSISYTEQKSFMNEGLEQVLNCDGAGYGWWQFQDVEWGNYSHQHLGLLNHQGITITADGDSVFGGLKHPDIPYFKGVKSTGDCDCGVNYFNMVGYENYLIEGKIIDEDEEGIDGAVIRGWSKEWIGVNTFTAKDGTFKLYSNTPLVHFQISAPGMELIKTFKELNYVAKKGLKDSSIVNEFLEYQKINYRNFLKHPEDSNASQFDFDPTMFDRYKFRADYWTVILSEVDL